jgi:DeoR/GlpR family transcriptional regulator of sugar metabolism
VTVAAVEEQFGVSPMTARRDLAELERQGLARRTHGGAVLPGISAHEDSFAQRLETATEAKAALARAACATIAPRESVFLDSSTTAYYLARRIVDQGLAVTIITNSLPVMELASTAASPNVELIGVGGSFRRLTRSFVGPVAVHSVLGHFADRLFLSVKGVTSDGTLTDPDALEAEVKRAMIEHAQESVLLIDDSKLAVRGLSAIAKLDDLTAVLTYGLHGRQLAPLRMPGVKLSPVDESA